MASSYDRRWSRTMAPPPPAFPPGYSSPAIGGVLSNRETGLLGREKAHRTLHFPEVFARRLQLENVLQGHNGCVNRLAWNEEGTKLASASDDRQVMLWSYPDTEQLPVMLETEHQGNIFGLAILPHSNDAKIVTGAMDSQVQLHTLEHRSSIMRNILRARRSLLARSTIEMAIVSTPATTQTFSCHRSRVKDVEVQPHNPNMFWSASEDGMVRQFDIRIPTSDQDRYESSNVLLGVKGKSRAMQLKALSINKAKPYQLALACGDPFVRIFDMRKLSTSSPEGDIYSNALLELAPPHMQHRASTLDNHSNATHVQFSNRGDKVVATYHGDHAYCFDVTGSASTYSSVFMRGPAPGSAPGPGMEKWKFNGNAAMFEKDFYSAVLHYSHGLQLAPDSTALLISRASAYMQRQWEGDAAFAFLDCEAALEINPELARAHLIRAQSLLAMRRFQLAANAVKILTAQFPGQHKEEATRLRETIRDEIAAAAKSRVQRRVMKARRQAQRERFAQERERRRLEATSAEGSGAQGSESMASEGPGNLAAASDDGGGERGPRASPLFDAFSDSDRWGILGVDRRLMMSDDDEVDESESDNEDSDMGSPTATTTASGMSSSSSSPLLGSIPSIWSEAQGGRRMMQRFIGQCNVQTDIKESVFLGADDNLVACGSDDGRVYIYHVETGAPVRVLEADDDVANCVQCHPTQAVLATSGIEAVIKIWSPGPNVDRTDVARLIKLNQARMKDGPQWYPRGAFQTAMRAHVLQTLTENPDLIPELRSLLVAQGGGGGRRQVGGDIGALPLPPLTAPAASDARASPRPASGSPANAAAAGTSSEEAREAEEDAAGGSSNRDDMDEDDMHHDMDDQNNPYVNCRMS